MLVKLKKTVDQKTYKRHPNPGRPNIICEFYKCSRERSYNEESQVCLGCAVSNHPIKKLYGNCISGWETKFCYTYYDDDSKENSNNRRQEIYSMLCDVCDFIYKIVKGIKTTIQFKHLWRMKRKE